MKYYSLGFSIICLALNFAYAQDNSFISLFDGKTMNGWTAAKENPGSFLIKDGMLICKGGRSHLFYSGEVGNADFKNFELKLRVRTTKGSNSGVYFHTKYQETGWPNIGFEAQVNSTQHDPTKTGSLYGVVNIWVPGMDTQPFGVRVNEKGEIFVYGSHAPSTDGEWFDYHIAVIDSKITIKVNGRTTVDWTQPKQWSSEGRRIGSGTLALQAHDPKSEVHYKDIRIRVLN